MKSFVLKHWTTNLDEQKGSYSPETGKKCQFLHLSSIFKWKSITRIQFVAAWFQNSKVRGRFHDEVQPELKFRTAHRAEILLRLHGEFQPGCNV